MSGIKGGLQNSKKEFEWDYERNAKYPFVSLETLHTSCTQTEF